MFSYFAKGYKAQTPQESLSQVCREILFRFLKKINTFQGIAKMSKNIKELREALQRQTQETLKLQEEATKFSVESITRREGASSPCNLLASSSVSVPYTSISPTVPSSKLSTVMESPTGSTIGTAAGGSPPKILFSKYELDIESQKRTINYPGKGRESIEAILEEYSQQVRDLQKRLSETTEQHEHQKLSLRQTIIELQTNLREVVREKESVTELRRKESQTQEDVNCKLKATVHELQTANQLQEEMLKEANNQTEHLKKMIQGHEDVLQELRNVLLGYVENSGRKIFEHESISNLHVCNLTSAFSKVLRDLDTEVCRLKGRVAPLEEQLDVMKKESQSKTESLLQQQQESIERLISEHEQELDILSEKANSSRSHASNIQSQLEIIQEQARNQNSLYMRQVSQLESTVSQLRSELRESRRMSQDKIEDLEKQLHLVHSEMAEAQSERDQYSQETGNLDDQVQRLMGELHKKEMELNLEKEQNKRLWDRDTGSSITIDHLRRELDNKNMELQRMDSVVKSMKMECQGQMERQMSAIKEKNESIEKVASMTSQQESTKEMLRKVVEELTEKKVSLESAERQVAELTSCLQEKERVIEATNEEVQKLRGRVDGKLQELQQLKSEGNHLRSLQSDCESLKLQLTEKEKVIEILRKQVDNMTQIVGQHGRAAGAMEMEKSQLLKEVNDKKLELHELKISQDKKDMRIRELEAILSEMELEKVKLMNTSSERLRALKEMKMEREELVNEIKSSRIELATLAEESDGVKSDYREKSEEMETTVNKLRVQLKSAHIELEQTRATLKTMEGSDGHAMKVAMGMQKQITAKRGQIDALQSKIKFLEEAMTNATKEKHYLKEERNKLSQELSCMASLNNKMAGELEILKSQDKRLREKLATMEAALDKASMQFAECQCIMQRQEQEVMRFKLQHTLDVKELQGPGYLLGCSSVKPRHSSLPHSHSSSAPSSQAFAGHISLMPSRSSCAKDDPLRDLKQLLQELRCTIDEIPSAILPRRESDSETDSLMEGATNTLDLASRECIGRRSHETYSREMAVRDLPSDVPMGQDTFSREPLTLHTMDLEDPDATLPFASSTVFSSTPRYTSSKKLSPERYKDRSPVHSLLTAPLDDLKTTPAASLECRSSLKKSSSPEATTSAVCRSISFGPASSIQTGEASGSACRKLQNKMESLQNLVETLQLKNQAMSTMIRCQEKKIEKAKEKEKKLSK
ncbi:coiled-coil domain-containing protein 158 [Rhineura floridana]|uniref:coiled-coil domain-containing protein 158 n=1 Tax=Rhineura floridana TaxID=261503 RepID=UPI002AC84596|nr:coiled-coil domain-containing protein 158 [Rhineura floridana]